MESRELAVRRRIAREFNLQRDDFPSLREYNDYLEEVEDIISNLVSQVRVKETQERIQAYRERFREQTAANQGRIAERERLAAARVEAEERQRAAVRARIAEAEACVREERTEAERTTVELQQQQQPAETKATKTKKKKKKQVAADTAAVAPPQQQQQQTPLYRPTTSFTPTAAATETVAMPPSMAQGLPSSAGRVERKPMSAAAERAAGWDPSVSKQRAIEEALSSLRIIV